MPPRGEGPGSDPFADTAAGAAAEPTPAAKPRRAVQTGDVLGRYELGDEVGEGGMATVFRARDRELRRDVALKVLFPHLAKRPEVVRRFQREARAAATLEHANILRVYDVGGGDAGAGDVVDPPFIVMELVRGRALLAEIEQHGPMFAEVVACAGVLLADALAAAHQAGIVHRDVKPSNVLVSHDGRLLLADFGVARLETEDSLITRTGAVLGTPAYMSPEQATGDTATARSDLYSLGATLYQLATGALPFTGSQAKVLAQVQSGALVPAVKRRAEVGPELSAVIDRLMAVDPQARPARASEVAADLRAIAAAAGFGEPAEELAAFLADRAAFVAAKTPRVVRALVAAGEKAIREDRLPRAIALAERASLLAPDDPGVLGLVATVTEGGRAERRQRRLTFGAIALGLVGAAVGAVALVGRGSSNDTGSATTGDVSGLASGVDLSGAADPGNAAARNERSFEDLGSASSLLNDPAFGPIARDTGAGGAGDITGSGDVRNPANTADSVTAAHAGNERSFRGSGGASSGGSSGASSAASSQVAAQVQTPRDAGVVVAAAGGTSDASSGAALAVAIDAGVARADGSAGGGVGGNGGNGTIVVTNDVWCDVTVDDRAPKRKDPGPALRITVPAGHHVVTCEQPGTGRAWKREVEVAAGGTTPASGALLADITVQSDIDATLDGITLAPGKHVVVKAGYHQLEARGAKKHADIRGPCTVRDRPELDCYP